MTRLQRVGAIALCVVMAGSAFLPAYIRGAAPAAAAKRTPKEIAADLTATDTQINELIPSVKAFGDSDFLKANGPKMLPLLKKMVALFSELGTAVDDKETKEQMTRMRLLYMSYAASLGDKESLTFLETAAKGKDDQALLAQEALVRGRWLFASKDPAAQTKILEDFAAVIKDHPEDSGIAQTIFFMANVGGANLDISKKVTEVARANLKGDSAKMLLSELDQMQGAAEAQAKLIGQPLAIEGRTSTGNKFSSSEYKGKVVLVDFWATWCGPCIAGLPEVKGIYKEYHDKGFEIVGVSCDSGDDVLNKFTAENQMPWMQLREESQSDGENWHPLAKKYGVLGIPTMFLIDRKGVARYVDAREGLGKKVAELLAESDKPAAPAK